MSQPLIPQPATNDPLSIRTGWILYSIFFGASVTEAVSVNLLPLTILRFTQDPSLIFWILAINPAFGFVAQPAVGVLSDRVWTRFGRRAIFILIAAPIVAVSLICIPFVQSLSWLIACVVAMQFFQDVINGADQPLVADLVAPNQRTLILGVVKAAEYVGLLLVLFVGIPMVEFYQIRAGDDYYGLPLYVTAALCQLGFVSVSALFIRERRRQGSPPSRFSPVRYVRDYLRQPQLPPLAFAYFLRSFARSAIFGSIALYAINTLHLSEQEFGVSWGLMPFVALTAGIPLGLVAERFPKHRVLQVAFGILIIGNIFGYVLGGILGMVIASLILGVGEMLLEVTHKAFMSEYYPANLIGQMAGTTNCFYAAGRVAGLVAVGQCVAWANPSVDWNAVNDNSFVDYSAMWLISSAAAILAILVLFLTRDLRYEIERGSQPSTSTLFAGELS
ncbi:MAG: MFS transporter [Blastopirellula sp. JB062]